MPTTYTGDKTQTQAPSDPPEPGGSIQASLPADGDAPNASTFAQAYKVCADFIDWLMKPQAVAGGSNWVKSIQTWLSAVGHQRFAIDHFGFPAGKLHHVRDDLTTDFSSPTGDSISDRVVGEIPAGDAVTRDLYPSWRWRTVTAGGLGGAMNFYGPGASGRNSSRAVLLTPGDTVGDYRYLARLPLCTFDASVVAVMEWDAKITALTTDVDIRMGMVARGQPTGLANGAWFKWTSGNWFLETNTGAGSSTADTGVAPVADTYARFRIVFLGANVDDGGVTRVLFFIDGALVGDRTATLPTSTGSAAPFFGIERVGVGVVPSLVVAGPINLANNTWLDAL